MAASYSLTLPTVSLHTAHLESRQQSASALLPLRESFQPGNASSCRKTALQGLMKKLVREGVHTRSGEQEAFRHEVCLSHMAMHVNGLGGQVIEIPLLFSDIIEAGRDGAGYLVAVAPRSLPASREGAAMTFEGASKALSPPLEDAWVFFVDGSYLDLQELFFEMGGRGALRWDLRKCYTITPNPLGEGGEGTVFLGQSAMSHKFTKSMLETDRHKVLSTNQVAIKTLKPSKTKAADDRVRAEIGFLARVRGHPNVTTLCGVFCDLVQREDGGTGVQEAPDGEPRGKLATVTWSVVMELCKSGDLFEHLLQHGPMDSNGCASLMEGLSSALDHLHGLGIVHRDVKPENILMDSCSRPVLADMGISGNLDDRGKLTGVIGSPGYAAPEVLLDQAYNQSVDIFSAGCTYYFAVACKQPFSATTVKGTLKFTIRCQPHFPKRQFSHVSAGLVELIMSCMSKDPSTRPSAHQALECLSELGANLECRHNEENSAQLFCRSPDGQHAEAPIAGPSVASAGPSSSCQSVPPALAPSPPASCARRPPRLACRVPAKSAVLAQPAERQEVAGRPAEPVSAEPSTPSDCSPPKQPALATGGPASSAERQMLVEKPAGPIGRQEKQEMLKKPAAMAPEGAQELASMPAAAEAAAVGQQDELHGSRGRVSLSPAKALRRMAGDFRKQFFPSFAQHSRNSASAGPAGEFFSVSSSVVSQGPLEHNSVPPQSAPSRRFSRRRR
eukprot:TRINITY_DN2762_c0_g1_i2.p1 TRINITY_DN2762_c0_g1~~TRINITY_DN2762_c0_g1_i2.p1  ORF type:complete len:730 (+),score=115.75 TRINITY_DN2762_c0_g1_i2:63-2252(+)